jgi:pimeloyl-ACP methyl ester carboxylesterase
MVHGWNGSGIQFERFLGPLTAAGFTAIAFDGPAHGASDGRDSSYFEITDVVRALLDPRAGHDVHAVIAHSLGASAVINAMTKERRRPSTVLIAPAIRLREMLWSTFDRYGVPRPVHGSLIDELGERFGYELQRDDPCNLLPAYEARTLVIHDENDRIVSIEDSRAACVRHPTMRLLSTRGLGHKRLLRDDEVVSRAVEHLLRRGDGAESRAVSA